MSACLRASMSLKITGSKISLCEIARIFSMKFLDMVIYQNNNWIKKVENKMQETLAALFRASNIRDRENLKKYIFFLYPFRIESLQYGMG